MDPQTQKLLTESGGLFVSMPFYELAKAAGLAQSPSKEAMARTLGTWLSGGDVKDAQGARIIPPRGIATVRRLSEHLAHLGVKLTFDCLPGSTLLGLARSVHVSRFRRTPLRAMLFVDDDILVEPEVIDAMLDAGGGGFVLLAYPQRGQASDVALRTLDGRNPRYSPVTRTVDGRRLLAVAGGGLGCALLWRTGIEKMVASYGAPFPEGFGFEDGDGTKHISFFNAGPLVVDGRPQYMGEDINFFELARAAGVPIECLADAFVDHAGWAIDLGAAIDALNHDDTSKKPYTPPTVTKLAPGDPRIDKFHEGDDDGHA